MSETSGNPPPPPHQPHDQPYGVPPSGHQQPQPPAPYAGSPYPAYGQGYGQPGFPMPGYGQPMRDPDARPGTVLAAAIVTMVLSGLVGLVMLVFVFFMVVARDAFMEGFTDSADLGSTDVYTPVLIGFSVVAVWCVVAFVLGILVLRRKNWARITLVVSSGVSAALSLLAITSGVSLLTLGGAIAVIVCLFTGGAGHWFHREHAYSQPRVP